MSNSVKIAVSAFASPSRVPLAGTSPLQVAQNNLDKALDLLEIAGRNKSDLACLPETFCLTGMAAAQQPEIAEPVDGSSIAKVSALARQYSMNIAAGFVLEESGLVWNAAILFDRKGEITGIYRKRFPTPPELASGVQPGETENVFETDIGRIGLSICFDINWPSVWQQLAEKDVDLVCWLSAYDGGFPLRSYAWANQYPVATAVMSQHARVIDISGEYLTSTTRWTPLQFCQLNLSKRIFHIDRQDAKILEIQRDYGDRVRVEGFEEENWFSIEPLAADLEMREIVKRYSLLDKRTYIAEAESLRAKTILADKAKGQA